MKHSKSSLVAAGIVLAAVSANSAFAQTIGFADAVNRYAIACKSDIAKYCKRVPLGGGRLGNCLAKNEKVSASCKATIVTLRAMVIKRADARASVMKVCDADIKRLCAGIAAGDGNLMQCFFAARKNASAQCRQMVVDAGYETPLAPDQPTTQIALNPTEIVAPGTLTAAGLRKLALEGMHDPKRAARVNRPPLVDQLNNMAQITIAIAFEFNSSQISPDSFKAVGLIADALNSPYLQNYRFLITGNTDAVGNREYNLKLSQERAEAIREALINPFGINPARLEVVGLGEEQLLDPAHPDAAENRRVQLINIGR
jgi:outer membrane protein OmpA-like peptidoglycan-associated protein